MTPIQRPQSSSETLRSSYYANIQAVGSQSAGRSMPPPSNMSHGGVMVSPVYNAAYSNPMQPAMSPLDSAQMQTPPPTRGASARKAQQTPQVAFGTPSTIASRRFVTPQHHVVSSSEGLVAQTTPMQFPQLQFSPDVYQFANMGPASAPVMPQSRVLWAQNSPIQPIPTTTLDDPFAPATSIDMSWSVPSVHQGNMQNVSFDTPAMDSFPTQALHPRPASAAAAPAPPPQAIGADVSTGVDPSLLYSSPIRLPPTRAKKSKSQVSLKDSNPKENGTSTHARSDTVSSADTANSRHASNLQRANTTGMTRPKSANFSASVVEAIHSHVPRTASPVKRFGRPSLGSISEGRPRLRTSVILTVDENGRARTETKRVEESPTRSIRERYPALFDSDSSDEESDGSEGTPSRPSSFIFDKRDERRTKAAKLDPPVENLEGLSIPRSGSSSSMRKGVPPSRASLAAAAQLRRQGSLRRSTPSRNSNRRSLMSNSSTSLIDTAPMDVQASSGVDQLDDQEQDNWTLPSQKTRATSSNAESALEAHNRRWSMMSFEQQQHTQPISPPMAQYQAHFQDYAAQVHSRPPQAQVLIRCLCGVQHDRGLALIQCHSCTQWLHRPCVGLDNYIQPPSFSCFLCTRPLSNMPISNAR
jgi:hypothetical protein